MKNLPWKNLPWRFPILFDFQLKVHSICTMMWEEFTSVVLNSCVIWNWNVIICPRWSAMPKALQVLNTVPHMHICVSVLWTSVFLWRFDDNIKALLFPTTLLYIMRISYCEKLGLKFTVSQQFKHQISSNCKYSTLSLKETSRRFFFL